MTTLPLALVILLLDFVQAIQYNVTVDDANPRYVFMFAFLLRIHMLMNAVTAFRITYTGPNWTTFSENSGIPIHLNQSLLQNGTSHFANGGDNSAAFNFTGEPLKNILCDLLLTMWGRLGHLGARRTVNIALAGLATAECDFYAGRRTGLTV
jgi:hypothetical protein